MAPAKLRAAALAVAVMVVCGGAMAAAYEQEEDCGVQRSYFLNCLGRGIMEGCCGVAAPRCLCLVERDAEVRCIRGPSGRRCKAGEDAKKVKLAELHLKCMENLKCHRA